MAYKIEGALRSNRVPEGKVGKKLSEILINIPDAQKALYVFKNQLEEIREESKKFKGQPMTRPIYGDWCEPEDK